jgi:hypothetical protein
MQDLFPMLPQATSPRRPTPPHPPPPATHDWVFPATPDGAPLNREVATARAAAAAEQIKVAEATVLHASSKSLRAPPLPRPPPSGGRTQETSSSPRNAWPSPRLRVVVPLPYAATKDRLVSRARRVSLSTLLGGAPGNGLPGPPLHTGSIGLLASSSADPAQDPVCEQQRPSAGHDFQRYVPPRSSYFVPHASPFRRRPPILSHSTDEDHYIPALRVAPEDPPACTFVVEGDADIVAHGGIDEPSNRRRRSRRASSIAGGGRDDRARTSPTRRNGRICFGEGLNGYLLDLTSNLLLQFTSEGRLEDLELTPGCVVSFRRSSAGDERIVATHLGPQLPSSRPPSLPGMALGSRSSSVVGGADAQVAVAASESDDALARSGDSFEAAATPTLVPMLAPGAGTAPPYELVEAGGKGPKGQGEGAERALEIPTRGWEFYRLLQAQRDPDYDRRLLAASPATIVRLVSASCAVDLDALGASATDQASKPRDLFEEAVPSSGPLLQTRAQAWARRQHPEVVMAAARRVLMPKDHARREDGEYLVFDDLPKRLKEADIEKWTAPPPMTSRSSRRAAANSAYGQWYLQNDAKRASFNEDARAMALTTAMQASESKTHPSPRRDRNSRYEMELVGESANNSHPSTTVAAHLQHRKNERRVARAVTTGRAFELGALTEHIENIQAGDGAAVQAMVDAAAKRTSAALASAHSTTVVEGQLAFAQQPAPSEEGSSTRYHSPASTAHITSPERDTALVGRGPSVGFALEQERKSTGSFIHRATLPHHAPITGRLGTSRAAQPPSVPSRRHNLPKQQYLGRIWALGQGDALTVRNAPNEDTTAADNAEFVMLAAKKPRRFIPVPTALERQPTTGQQST